MVNHAGWSDSECTMQSHKIPSFLFSTEEALNGIYLSHKFNKLLYMVARDIWLISLFGVAYTLYIQYLSKFTPAISRVVMFWGGGWIYLVGGYKSCLDRERQITPHLHN